VTHLFVTVSQNVTSVKREDILANVTFFSMLRALKFLFSSTFKAQTISSEQGYQTYSQHGLFETRKYIRINSFLSFYRWFARLRTP
jgi:hypothetical protein